MSHSVTTRTTVDVATRGSLRARALRPRALPPLHALRMRAGRPPTRSRVDHAIGWLIWVVMVGGVSIDLLITGWTLVPDRDAVSLFCMVFFAILVVRLVLAARRRTKRRLLPVVLILGILLWAAESTILQSAQAGGGQAHLAGGELAFIACYPVLASYLLLDCDRRPAQAVSTWLETTIICAGSASAVGLLLVTPLAGSSSALSLLVALLYPVLDVALGVLVLGQISLGIRGRDRCSASLVLGFAMLTAADGSFVHSAAHGSGGSSVVDVVLWGAGFAFIVSAACRNQDRAERAADASGDLPASVLVVAALAAIGVLTMQPANALGVYVVVPAVITLLAAGGRLLLALRDARGASEAVMLSMTDDLTSLPNRRAILSSLDAGLREERPLALIMMDLDGFKDINDTLGHGHGDLVLRTSADRMRAALPPEVLVARLGGDEFALVVPHDDEIELVEMANHALDAIRQPTIADGIELVIDASVGIAVRGPEDTASGSLLRRADVAMYQSKAGGTGPLIYESSRDAFSRQRLQLNEELRRGIGDGQLEVWYQPQIDATTRAVIGLEALVRWRHPRLDLVSPAAFLPAARHAGLMPMLSEEVIAQAVRDVATWRGLHLTPRVSLNCAPPELLSGIFLRQLTDAVARAGVEIDDFVLEVTEDSFLADPDRARSALAEVRRRGLQISIDDYGTGFSSLTYLRELPVDELKMDRSFVSMIEQDPRTRMIVESTVNMAHALDLRIVAEGVEDAATSARLISMGADGMQGYHFARPMHASEVAGWLTRWASENDELWAQSA